MTLLYRESETEYIEMKNREKDMKSNTSGTNKKLNALKEKYG